MTDIIEGALVEIKDDMSQHIIVRKEPAEIVAEATKIANVLKEVIEKQKLYAIVGQGKHVTVEGWTTLGAMYGIFPREVSVKEMTDGSFEAVVELFSSHTGQIVGQGSAICDKSERFAQGKAKNQIRSMAITRATGKAFRLGMGWIMKLAGYEPAPREEMDDIPFAPKKEEKKPSIYTGTSEQQKKVADILKAKKVPEDKWDLVSERMMNKPSTELETVIKGVME